MPKRAASLAIGIATIALGVVAQTAIPQVITASPSASSSITALATNAAMAGPTADDNEVLLPVPAGSPYPSGPGGKYYTQGNYEIYNPNCWIKVFIQGGGD
jgi:hypothetical protein